MVVHAILAVVLARLGATDDVVVGTPVAGRGRPELDSLIGMFVNSVPLRTPVDHRAPFTSLLEVVRERDLAAFAHPELAQGAAGALVQRLDVVGDFRALQHAERFADLESDLPWETP